MAWQAARLEDTRVPVTRGLCAGQGTMAAGQELVRKCSQGLEHVPILVFLAACSPGWGNEAWDR